ncbi:MAG: HIT domain-containing protein [Desulfurococcaceae archaeon]
MEIKILWNPWRIEYIKSFNERKTEEECIFCRLKDLKDEEALIVHRGKYSFVVLNAYPYNSGHMMIAPYRHIPDFENLSEEEIHEIMFLTKKSIKVLKEVYKPNGFNIGLNIGRAAGAGVPGHIHLHIVPRWIGDTNFMAIIAGVKPLPESLKDSYNAIIKAWSRM